MLDTFNIPQLTPLLHKTSCFVSNISPISHGYAFYQHVEVRNTRLPTTQHSGSQAITLYSIHHRTKASNKTRFKNMHIMSNKKLHTQSAKQIDQKSTHNTTLAECVATLQFIKLKSCQTKFMAIKRYNCPCPLQEGIQGETWYSSTHSHPELGTGYFQPPPPKKSLPIKYEAMWAPQQI